MSVADTGTRQCDSMATARSAVSARFDATYRCPHPAKYRVQSRDRRTGEPNGAPFEGEYVCGRHVRPALLDNADSVWRPWLVTVLVPGSDR